MRKNCILFLVTALASFLLPSLSFAREELDEPSHKALVDHISMILALEDAVSFHAKAKSVWTLAMKAHFNGFYFAISAMISGRESASKKRDVADIERYLRNADLVLKTVAKLPIPLRAAIGPASKKNFVSAEDEERFRVLVKSGNLEARIVQELKKLVENEEETVDLGQLLNVRNPRNGQSPLMTAVLEEREDVVRMLLRHGANLELEDEALSRSLT